MKIVFVNSDKLYVFLNTPNTVILSLTQHPQFDNIASLIVDNQDNMDNWYPNYILHYTSTFLDLMKIIYAAYEGNNVVIIVPSFCENFIENITRLLYHRYGLLAYYVRDNIEDLNFIEETDFSVAGLEALDFDKDRLCRVVKHMEPTIELPIAQTQSLYTKL